MKHPYLKLAGAVILICALLFGYYRLVTSRINVRNAASVARLGADRLDSIVEAMADIEAEREKRLSAVSDRLLASAKLEAAMLRLSPAYGKHAVREDGMMVQVKGGDVRYPAGSDVRFEDYGDLFTDAGKAVIGTVVSEADGGMMPALICASPVRDDAYYVAWVDGSDDAGLFSSNAAEQMELKRSVEISHRGYYLDIADTGEQLVFNYKSYIFEDRETPGSLGFTREVLEARPARLEIDGKGYGCVWKTLREGEETGVFLTELSNPTFQTESQAAIIAAVAGILLACVAAWLLATQRFVVEKILTKPMQVRYKPLKVRWMTLVLGMVGVVTVLLTTCVVHTIGNFFARSVEGYVSMVVLESRLEQDEDDRASNARADEAWRLACGRHMAEAIGADPELAAAAPLAEFSDAIGANYIMLFDGDGNESACSARYTGFALGEKEEDSTTDFRRLLLGVPELVHAPAVDERTGLNTRMVGVGCPMPDGRYGALILAFNADGQDESTRVNALFHYQTPPELVALAFDRESKTVRYASEPLYVGSPIDAFGIPEDHFAVSYMDSIQIMGRRCYGLSAEWNDLVLYMVDTAGRSIRGTAVLGLQAAAGFAAIYLVLALCLLLGYTNRWYKYYSVIGDEFDTRATETVLPNGRVKRSVDPSRRWAFSFTALRNMLPEQVARSVFGLCVSLCIVWAGVDLMVRRINSNGVVAFIVSGEWARGFNLFAVVAILMLALAIVFGLMLIKLALKLTSMAMDTKGETICRLAYNLLEYVAVLLLLFYSFEFLGIDVRALLAPLALVSLALSLVSRQLVEDILAGITIVFEGEYQVGDVIDVGGYRGKVVEVGVRTTKLLGRGDNIKIISNRDVRNVLNMSRMNSWIDMEFSVANTVPIQKIEEIMDRELPGIGRSIPDIISGPIYKGIVSMNGSRITIAVTCECNEEVSFRVQRDLYARFHEMFERESLPLA